MTIVNVIFYIFIGYVSLVIIRIGYKIIRSVRFKIDIVNQIKMVMPRLVSSEFLKQAKETYPDGIPHREFYSTGLYIVYVIDHKNNMAFIRNNNLKDSGFDEGAIYEIAMENFKLRYPQNLVKKSIDDNSMIVLKTFDGYDAARLILIPWQIENGQSVAVTIPDRNTLSICPLPKDNQWDALKSAAKSFVDTPLFDKPLIVSRDNVIVVE